MSEDPRRHAWLSIGEAAEILGVPPKTVQDWMDKGYLHYVKSYMTGLPWVSRASVKDILAKAEDDEKA